MHKYSKIWGLAKISEPILWINLVHILIFRLLGQICRPPTSFKKMNLVSERIVMSKLSFFVIRATISWPYKECKNTHTEGFCFLWGEIRVKRSCSGFLSGCGLCRTLETFPPSMSGSYRREEGRQVTIFIHSVYIYWVPTITGQSGKCRG